jgi:hypothetical protein
MRHLAVGLCVCMAACAGSTPTSPTTSAPPTSVPANSVPPSTAVGQTLSSVGASNLPFKGTLQATETGIDQVVHHLVGSGEATELGHFAYAAEISVDPVSTDGAGTVTWTAANGDQLLANTAGTVIGADFPIITIQETQTIAGGTGGFADASGTVILVRTLNLDTGATSGSWTGTLSRGR